MKKVGNSHLEYQRISCPNTEGRHGFREFLRLHPLLTAIIMVDVVLPGFALGSLATTGREQVCAEANLDGHGTPGDMISAAIEEMRAARPRVSTSTTMDKVTTKLGETGYVYSYTPDDGLQIIPGAAVRLCVDRATGPLSPVINNALSPPVRVRVTGSRDAH